MIDPLSYQNPVVQPQKDSATGLADNFNSFLTLLTSQLQNQDPLSPLDSNEFVNQLVSFSGVEQQIKASSQLEKLVALQQGTLTTTAVGYLGKNVRVESPHTMLKDGSAEWIYAMPQDAVSTKLLVYDQDGKVVFSKSGEGASGPHTFTWDGKDAGGTQLEDGVYTLKVQSLDSDGKAIEVGVGVKAKITSVDLSGPEPMVTTETGNLPLSAVVRIDA
jgi:flagellar basal-body rod modification protein FlgD